MSAVLPGLVSEELIFMEGKNHPSVFVSSLIFWGEVKRSLRWLGAFCNDTADRKVTGMQGRTGIGAGK